MNKSDFITYISDKHAMTKVEAEKIIDMFTSSAIGAISEGEEISLIGFGKLFISKVDERPGRNPKTGETVQIKAYNQPRFKVGQKMKDAVNNK
jgi:nucleoid DNA-binding protein